MYLKLNFSLLVSGCENSIISVESSVVFCTKQTILDNLEQFIDVRLIEATLNRAVGQLRNNIDGKV